VCQLLRELTRGVESIIRLVGKRAHEKTSERSQIGAGQFRQRVGRLSPETGDSFRPQPLVDQDGQTENIGPPIPGRRSCRPFWRGVWSPRWSSRPGPLERARDPEAGQPDIVSRHEHIARVQGAMDDLGVRRRIEGAGEVRGNPGGLGGRRRPALP
jgi:hypothetical protein